jgi:hypothetical protein
MTTKRNHTKKPGGVVGEPLAVHCSMRRDKTLVVQLRDGRTLLIRPSVSTRLSRATLRQLSNFRSRGGEGFHWPDLDEDLSVRGFLAQARSRPECVVIVPAKRSAAHL